MQHERAQLQLGPLSRDKERESISCQWARRRGTDWCLSAQRARPLCPAHTGWDSSLPKKNEWEELGGCPAASKGVCCFGLLAAKLCRTPCSTPRLQPSTPSQDQSDDTDRVNGCPERRGQWAMERQPGQRATGCIMADL